MVQRIARSVLTVTTVTEDTTAGADTLILVNAATGPVKVTLPAAATDLCYYVKKIDSSENEVTVEVDDTANEEIDGAETAVITDQYECLTIVSDGTDWWIC
jgi:hypothetical protein